MSVIQITVRRVPTCELNGWCASRPRWREALGWDARRSAMGRADLFEACFRNGRYCAGFWTPASGGAPLAPAAGVQKAPRHEVAGSLGRVGSQRYGDLIFASIMTVGAKL